jgi:hypothetical protein
MKKISFIALGAMSVTLIPAMQQIHAASVKMNGVVSDSMCGKKHMMPGKTDVQCIQECIKSGSNYALVVGEKVYALAIKPQMIAPFAGKRVHIEGDLLGDRITVTSIAEAMTKGMKM